MSGRDLAVKKSFHPGWTKFLTDMRRKVVVAGLPGAKRRHVLSNPADIEARAQALWSEWLTKVRHLPADRPDTWDKVGETMREHFRQEARQ